MDKESQFRRRTLQHILLTKFEPKQIARSERLVTWAGVFLLLTFIVGPILYYRDLGSEKYVLLLCGAIAGLVAFYWQMTIEGNKGTKALHDYIDFEKVKSDVGDGDT